MRIWSIHPKYLDEQSLKECWNDGIVLLNNISKEKRSSYSKICKTYQVPVVQITTYLYFILQESLVRDYKLDSSKLTFGLLAFSEKVEARKGEITVEFSSLMENMKDVNFNKYRRLSSLKKIELHPLFKIVK